MVPAATEGRTLSHQKQTACLRQRIRDDSATRSAPELVRAIFTQHGLRYVARSLCCARAAVGRHDDEENFEGHWQTGSAGTLTSRRASGPARLGGMGMGRNRLQGHDVHNSVAGPPGQTNWISQDLDSFSHNQSTNKTRLIQRS